MCSVAVMYFAGSSVAGARAGTASSSASLTLITEPKDGVAPFLSAIEHARHEIDLVMYENEGKDINAALAAAQRRGVQVRVLLGNSYYGEPSQSGCPEERQPGRVWLLQGAQGAGPMEPEVFRAHPPEDFGR